MPFSDFKYWPNEHGWWYFEGWDRNGKWVHGYFQDNSPYRNTFDEIAQRTIDIADSKISNSEIVQMYGWWALANRPPGRGFI